MRGRSGDRDLAPARLALGWFSGSGRSPAVPRRSRARPRRAIAVVRVWNICRHDCVGEIRVAASGAAGAVRGVPHCSPSVPDSGVIDKAKEDRLWFRRELQMGPAWGETAD
ncbi:hypothetical protein MJG53_018835 [Ovis ammon polii x Ovis aries]|uniref:Uncharacterized protein n=2 Tax=Ovis TaxID=9935 RepID=A0A835ZJF8_SHEEP|nr:hypothetical protein JEQ12_013105 [Ovis aries]KAI4556881.1 hypothetical protein MJG53_018835 [Ovis ammon polii x Ovis aries]